MNCFLQQRARMRFSGTTSLPRSHVLGRNSANLEGDTFFWPLHFPFRMLNHQPYFAGDPQNCGFPFGYSLVRALKRQMSCLRDSWGVLRREMQRSIAWLVALSSHAGLSKSTPANSSHSRRFTTKSTYGKAPPLPVAQLRSGEIKGHFTNGCGSSFWGTPQIRLTPPTTESLHKKTGPNFGMGSGWCRVGSSLV